MSAHTSQAHYSETFEANEDDWFEPVCVCGKKVGVYPTAEDACDALMQHAYEAGFIDAQAGMSTAHRPEESSLHALFVERGKEIVRLREGYERLRESRDAVVGALEQAVIALDLATDALAAGKPVERAVLTAKLASATRELRASVAAAGLELERG